MGYVVRGLNTTGLSQQTPIVKHFHAQRSKTMLALLGIVLFVLYIILKLAGVDD